MDEIKELTAQLEALKLKNSDLTRKLIDAEQDLGMTKADARDSESRFQRERIENGVLDGMIDKLIEKLAG